MSAFLATLLVLMQAPRTPRPVGTVLQVKGSVLLKRGEKPAQRVFAMQKLLPGDQLQVGKNSETLVLFSNLRHIERIKAASQVIVKEQGCFPPARVERLKQKLSAENLDGIDSTVKNGRLAGTVIRGENSRSETPPEKARRLTPMYADTTLTRRPQFAWPAAPNVEGYAFQLFNGLEGREKRLLWQAKTKKPKLVWPTGRKPLKWGSKYQWQVSIFQSGRKGKTIVQSKFFVITKIQKMQIKQVEPFLNSKDQTKLLLVALLYEAHGLDGATLQIYRQLVKLQPHEPNYHLALANYLERAGHLREAEAEPKRAKQLRQEKPCL